MSIDTTKQIKKVTYNGTEIPLAGGSSSSSETATVNITTSYEDPYSVMDSYGMKFLYQTPDGVMCNYNGYLDDTFTLSNVLINSVVYLICDNQQITGIKLVNVESTGVEEINITSDDGQNVTLALAYKILSNTAQISIMLQ